MSIEKKFDPAKRKKLNNPIRLQWIPPWKIEGLLEMKEGGVYLDIGAGTGYITKEIAVQAPEAKIYALDIEPLMVEEMKKCRGQESVFPRLMERDILAFDGNSIAGVWSITVFHELGKAAPLLREIRRVLRPGGRLLLVDWEKTPEASEQGPPLEHRVTVGEVMEELKNEGFDDVQMITGFIHHFAILATK